MRPSEWQSLLIQAIRRIFVHTTRSEQSNFSNTHTRRKHRHNISTTLAKKFGGTSGPIFVHNTKPNQSTNKISLYIYITLTGGSLFGESLQFLLARLSAVTTASSLRGGLIHWMTHRTDVCALRRRFLLLLEELITAKVLLRHQCKKLDFTSPRF